MSSQGKILSFVGYYDAHKSQVNLQSLGFSLYQHLNLLAIRKEIERGSGVLFDES